MTGPSLTVSALTFNAHLFGHGAEFYVDGARRETGFYFHDAERLPQSGPASYRFVEHRTYLDGVVF